MQPPPFTSEPTAASRRQFLPILCAQHPVCIVVEQLTKLLGNLGSCFCMTNVMNEPSWSSMMTSLAVSPVKRLGYFLRGVPKEGKSFGDASCTQPHGAKSGPNLRQAHHKHAYLGDYLFQDLEFHLQNLEVSSELREKLHTRLEGFRPKAMTERASQRMCCIGKRVNMNSVTCLLSSVGTKSHGPHFR